MYNRQVGDIRDLLSKYEAGLGNEMSGLIRIHLSDEHRKEFTETGGYEPLIRDLFLSQHKLLRDVVDKLLEILDEIDEPKQDRHRRI